MGLKLVVKPGGYPVDLEEAKAHLREESADFNLQIEAFIAAATGYAEWFQGRALIEQTWDLYLDAFPAGSINIPKPPLIDIDGVFYTDAAGVEHEIDDETYVVDAVSEPGRLMMVGGAAWPTTGKDGNAVRIRFRAGYPDTEDSPPEITVPFETRAAILMHVGDLYANRESMVVGDSVTTIPWSAEQLLRVHRFNLGMA